MKKGMQEIKDPETEARELEDILREVGKSLQESTMRLGKSGLTYAQFKANFLKKMTAANELPHLTEAH